MIFTFVPFFLTMRDRYTWTLPRISIELGVRTAVMGILNVTPDSFSPGGRHFDRDDAVAYGQDLEQQGADILDIGGESTRPGSEPVSEDEEIRRVVPVIEKLTGILKIPISVDTYRAAVAKRAIESGAQIVNDIGGFRFDADLPELVRTTRAGVVLMHSRGRREEIHRQPAAADPVQTVMDGLQESLKAALVAGVDSSSIVVDPGLGFSKDADANIRILRNLSVFSKLHHPILVGTSRKAFIRAIVGVNPESVLLGTASTVAVAIAGGGHIVRVHDVRQMRVIVDVADRIVSMNI